MGTGRAREQLSALSVPLLARQAYLLQAEALIALGRPADARQVLDDLTGTFPELAPLPQRFALQAQLAAGLDEWERAFYAALAQIKAERSDAEVRLTGAVERTRARLDFEAARLQRTELEAALRLRESEIRSSRRQARWQSATIVLALALLAMTAIVILRQRQAGAELSQLAMSDALTRLPNRRAFFRKGERAVAQAQRTGAPVSMLMLDLDHFKSVNDRFGHAAGDVALASFAAVLRDFARDEDLPVRLGGEEFGLLLPGTDRDGGIRAAERLMATLRSAPWLPAELPFRLSASVGVAELEAGESLDALLERADVALYQAKADGRDRVIAADSQPGVHRGRYRQA